jgi:hypothetical protein
MKVTIEIPKKESLSLIYFCCAFYFLFFSAQECDELPYWFLLYILFSFSKSSSLFNFTRQILFPGVSFPLANSLKVSEPIFDDLYLKMHTSPLFREKSIDSGPSIKAPRKTTYSPRLVFDATPTDGFVGLCKVLFFEAIIKLNFNAKQTNPLQYYVPENNDSTLVFESRFESGNLLRAVQTYLIHEFNY